MTTTRILLCLATAFAFAPTSTYAAEPPPEPDKPAADAPAKAAAPEAAAAPAPEEKPAAVATEKPAQADPAAPEKGPGEAPVADADKPPKPATKVKKAPAVPEPLDDQARFLAGMPVPEGSPLAPLTQTRFWKAYAKKFDGDWEKLKKERLDATGDWAAKVLAARIDPKAPVFYLFGGPDFLSVPVLYPEAPVYILGGLEPVGNVPRLAGMGTAALEEDMRNLRMSLNSIIRLSFFKTNDMRDDLIRTELRGVAPLLFVLAARSGAKLLEASRVEINDKTGELRVLTEREKCVGVPGVRLKIQREGRDPQEIFYFKHDVSDPVIKAGPGFLTFFKRYAPANTFLKAASFLLHRPKQFGQTADFLLSNSKSILQDDSGLAFASLADKERFDLTLFGTYLRPRPPFTKRIQPDMAEAFKAGPVEPLPFLTGYRKAGESNLVLAVPRKQAAAPAATPAPAPAAAP